ncbi:MAG: GldG family protein [Syntrophales bacterium]|nr:GldG family protein [Syntrophales bacterium]MDD5643240.1 GldG family protein [Syntrophales bacterium]
MSWRDLFHRRTLIYGGSSAASVILVVGILVLAGLLANRFPLRWDVTKDKSQSLTPMSRALLPEVKHPLTMTAFFPEGHTERQRAKEVLQMYAYANRQITFQLVDPEREPLKAKEAGYRYPGNVLLEYQGRRQMADKTDEEALTNAVRKLLRPEAKKIYFLTGHGERTPQELERNGFSTAGKALENEGYKLENLNLLTKAEVPKDAAAVVAAGPARPLFPNEAAALKAYLQGGGRILLLLAPFKDAGLKDFLSGYGIDLNDGIILDMNQVSQAIGASAIMPMAMQYGAHRITRDFTNVVTIYPLARPLILKQGIKDVTLLPLVTSTNTSWEKLGQAWFKEKKGGFDPKTDKKGPFTLAALAELKPPSPKEEKGKTPEKKTKEPEKKPYLVVFGDVDFAANAYFNLSGNGDLFLNTLNFLAAQENQIVVHRETGKAQPLTLQGWQAWFLFLTCVVALPLIMLAAGVRAYLRRRRGRQ